MEDIALFHTAVIAMAHGVSERLPEYTEPYSHGDLGFIREGKIVKKCIVSVVLINSRGQTGTMAKETERPLLRRMGQVASASIKSSGRETSGQSLVQQ